MGSRFLCIFFEKEKNHRDLSNYVLTRKNAKNICKKVTMHTGVHSNMSVSDLFLFAITPFFFPLGPSEERKLRAQPLAPIGARQQHPAQCGSTSLNHFLVHFAFGSTSFKSSTFLECEHLHHEEPFSQLLRMELCGAFGHLGKSVRLLALILLRFH